MDIYMVAYDKTGRPYATALVQSQSEVDLLSLAAYEPVSEREYYRVQGLIPRKHSKKVKRNGRQ